MAKADILKKFEKADVKQDGALEKKLLKASKKMPAKKGKK